MQQILIYYSWTIFELLEKYEEYQAISNTVEKVQKDDNPIVKDVP